MSISPCTRARTDCCQWRWWPWPAPGCRTSSGSSAGSTRAKDGSRSLSNPPSSQLLWFLAVSWPPVLPSGPSQSFWALAWEPDVHTDPGQAAHQILGLCDSGLLSQRVCLQNTPKFMNPDPRKCLSKPFYDACWYKRGMDGNGRELVFVEQESWAGHGAGCCIPDFSFNSPTSCEVNITILV